MIIAGGADCDAFRLAPWSDAQKAAVVEALRSASFSGGQDNAPALAEALLALEAEPQATLLWIHGPQPISFRGSAARLEQATARLSRLPERRALQRRARPERGAARRALGLGRALAAADRRAAMSISRASSRAHRARRRRSRSAAPQEPATDGVATGSDHIARLWANERVLELMRQSGGNRAEAVALATRYHLVTPVSGAVVLETKQQYDESRLTPVSQATVPTRSRAARMGADHDRLRGADVAGRRLASAAAAAWRRRDASAISSRRWSMAATWDAWRWYVAARRGSRPRRRRRSP